MFGRLKDWRRVATHYNSCPKVFFSAVAHSEAVMFGYDWRTRCRNGACVATRPLPLQSRG